MDEIVKVRPVQPFESVDEIIKVRLVQPFESVDEIIKVRPVKGCLLLFATANTFYTSQNGLRSSG